MPDSTDGNVLPATTPEYNMADAADVRAYQNSTADSGNGMFNEFLAERQRQLDAEHAQYGRQPVDLSNAPAWWRDVSGVEKHETKFPWQQPNRTQLPISQVQSPALGLQRSHVAPNLADVSAPRYALGIPNWRNYSSALRRQ